MFHLFEIDLDRNHHVKNWNSKSPFVSEKAADDFFYNIIPTLLKGIEVRIHIDQLDKIFDEVKHIPNETSMMLEIYDKKANLVYSRLDLLKMLCKTLKISLHIEDRYQQVYLRR